MPTNKNRIMLSLPADMEEELRLLKKTVYFDRPYSEICRDLIRLGVEKNERNNERE